MYSRKNGYMPGLHRIGAHPPCGACGTATRGLASPACHIVGRGAVALVFGDGSMSGTREHSKPDAERVFCLLSEIRALKEDPARQREQARAGLRELFGPSSSWGRAYGRPLTRRFAWFLGWIDEREPIPAANALPHWREGDGEHRLFRLFVSELYRLHRSGCLDAGRAPADLPPRRQQVLDRVLRGRGVKQIASDLGISRWTVDEHLRAIYRHFDVSGREELIARFIAPGPRPRDIPSEDAGAGQRNGRRSKSEAWQERS